MDDGRARPGRAEHGWRSYARPGSAHDVELYHGSIRDPVWEYVIDDRTAAICLEHQGTALSLVGHSHVPLAYGYANGTFLGGLAPADTRLETAPARSCSTPGRSASRATATRGPPT